MVLVSWWLGRKHYPIPYQVVRIMVYIMIAIGLYALAEISNTEEIINEFSKIMKSLNNGTKNPGT